MPSPANTAYNPRGETNGHVGSRLLAAHGATPRVVHFDYQVYQPKPADPIYVPPTIDIVASIPSTATSRQPVSISMSGVVTGGTPPYQYIWEFSPAVPATTFSDFLPDGVSYSSVNDAGTPELNLVVEGIDQTRAFTVRLRAVDIAGREIVAARAVSIAFQNTLVASVSPSDLSASAPGNTTATTAPATVTISGGVAPYAVDWQRVSGSLAIGANAPGNATTTFYSSSAPFTVVTGQWRAFVIDAVGNTRYSAPVSLTFEFFDDDLSYVP